MTDEIVILPANKKYHFWALACFQWYIFRKGVIIGEIYKNNNDNAVMAYDVYIADPSVHLFFHDGFFQLANAVEYITKEVFPNGRVCP